MTENKEVNNLDDSQLFQNESTEKSYNKYREVSFDDISLNKIDFKEEYKLIMSTSSQIIVGIQNMTKTLNEGENDYKNRLLSKIKELSLDVVQKYENLLITTEGVQRRVFGVNLNGLMNNGRLNRPIEIKNIKYNLAFKYAKFGDLLTTLINRMYFIAERDETKIKRYQLKVDEKTEFVLLKQKVGEYLLYLDNVNKQWIEFIKNMHNSPDYQQLTNNNSQYNKRRNYNNDNNLHHYKRNTNNFDQQQNTNNNHYSNDT